MYRMLFDFLVCTFAAYGFVCLIKQIPSLIHSRVHNETGKIRILLLIKDQEEHIEGIIRNIFMGDILRRYIPGSRLTVVDMGSKDQTVEILQRLAEEYPGLEAVAEPGRRRYLHTLGLGIYFKKGLKT